MIMMMVWYNDESTDDWFDDKSDHVGGCDVGSHICLYQLVLL